MQEPPPSGSAAEPESALQLHSYSFDLQFLIERQIQLWYILVNKSFRHKVYIINIIYLCGKNK